MHINSMSKCIIIQFHATFFPSMKPISQAHVERHAWPATEAIQKKALPANITLLCPS